MPTLSYDAANHFFYLTSYDDITFALGGAPDGDFFTVTYANDATSSAEGAQGDVQFSQRVASLGNVTYTSQWGAETNKILNQVFKDQQKGLYMQTAELKRISNIENVTVLTCSRAMIQKVPDYTIGTESSDRGWTFALEKMTFKELQTPA